MQKHKWALMRIYRSHVFGVGSFMFGAICGIWGPSPIQHPYLRPWNEGSQADLKQLPQALTYATKVVLSQKWCKRAIKIVGSDVWPIE